MNKYFILIAILLCIACKITDKKYKLIETKVNINNQLDYQLIDVSFVDSAKVAGGKYAVSNLFIKDSNEYIAFVNQKDSLFYLYNITQEKTILTYPVMNRFIGGTYIVSLDTIFLLDFDSISLLHNNKIINSWSINYDTNTVACLSQLDQNIPYFNKTTQELIVEQYGCGYDFDSDSFFTVSPIAFFNIKNSTHRTPNITYSKKYFTNYYGFLNKAYISNDNKNIYISYPIDPNIYIVDLKTLEQKIVGGKSTYQLKDATPLDGKYRDNKYGDKKIQHLVTAYDYSRVYVDPYRKLFYRFYTDAIPEKNEDGLFNSLKDKDVILMVFDENFTLINEFKFPKKDGIFTNFGLVGKDGFYIIKNAQVTLLKINGL
ncbi:MAG: DUF4221 family protein [Chitinophagales bacterium]|nr:DUF4221 family protein [Chitinophagales bacterium]